MNRLAFLLLLVCSTTLAAVPQRAEDIRPLLPGQRAPAFVATNAYQEQVHFDPDSLQRPTVLIFYRGGWCPYCNLYWSELRRVEDDLLALNLDLMFLSADSPEVLAEAVDGETERPAYQLLSDASSDIAQAFGIAFRLDDATYEKYKAMGLVDLEQASGFTHHYLPAPAVFIIDSSGTIVFEYVNPDYKVRLAPEVLLAAARSMPEYKLQKIMSERRAGKP